MSNPNKQWSWGVGLGRGVGGAIGAGGSGAVMGVVGGLGPLLGGGIGAFGGFLAGFTGYALGHMWDDPPLVRESAGSAILYTTVVSGGFAALLEALMFQRLPNEPNHFCESIFAISILTSFLSSLSKSWIDDMRATKEPLDARVPGTRQERPSSEES